MLKSVNAYATYATGFKSVGLNMNGLPTDALDRPVLSAATVRPEDERHIEVGIKTNPFTGVTANFTVYDTDIKDFQAQVVNAGVGVLRGYLANAEKVRVRGAEFDGNARINRSLTLYGAVAYSDGKYISFPDAPPPLEDTGGPQVKDISGSVLPGLSKWALSVGGEYVNRRTIFGHATELFGALDTSYRSSFSSSSSASRYLDRRWLWPAQRSNRRALVRGVERVVVVAQPARQELLRAPHRSSRQHRALRRSAGGWADGGSDDEGWFREISRPHPVFLIPAATPLIVTSSARRSHTVSSACLSRALRSRRKSSTCSRLMGST